VVAGHRDILLPYLKKLIWIMLKIYRSQKHKIIKPLDMYMVNFIAYKYFDKNIYRGDNLVTSFGGNSYDKTKAIKHK
jgi:hypothetical protein